MQSADMDNDTRGWIMSVVSGLGTSSQSYHLTSQLTVTSMCCWGKYNLCRYSTEAGSRVEKLPYPGQ